MNKHIANMKNLSLITLHSSLITLLAAMTACSSDDDGQTDSNDSAKPRLLTITQIEQPGTRATLHEENEALAASWTAGDNLTYATLNRIGNSYYNGTLTAKTTAPSSAFTGSVMCSQNNKLAVIYPQATTLTTDNSSYTISLAGQDGTLPTLATRYHYVYGVATVNAVTETTATAMMDEKMKSLLTVVKFKFVDTANGDAPVKVKSLAISYDDADGGYPQKATVTTNLTQSEVYAEGEGQGKYEDNKLIINLPTATTEGVYVALVPGGTPKTETTDGRLKFFFSVTDYANRTYTGTKMAVLAEGEFATTTIKVKQ